MKHLKDERVIYMHIWLKQSQLLLCLIILLIACLPVTTFAAPKQPKNHITYIAIGDSLTEGLLASRALSASNGYYEYVVEALKSKGYIVKTANFAKSGATSTEIIAQLHHLSDYPNGADILTVSVGLNDLKPHLAPISDKELKKKMIEANKTFMLFQQEAEQAEEYLRKTEDTFTQLEQDITILKNLIQKTKVQLETNPDFAKLENTEDKVSSLNQLSTTIDSVMENVSSTKEQLSLPKENIHAEEFTEVMQDIKLVYEGFAALNNQLSKSLSKLSEHLSPKLKETAQEKIGQTQNNLESARYTVITAQTQLKQSYQALKDVEKAYMQVPTAQSVIKNSFEVMNKAFENAHGEINNVENNIATIINHAQKLNPEVDVYLLGYYNTFPYKSDALQKQTVTLLTSLNDAIERTATREGATYVPSFDAFDGRYEELLPNPNDIHPSQAGYQVIAEQFILALNSNYPTISSSILEEDNPKNIIEQAEKNVALKLSEDNKGIEKWLLTSFQANTKLILLFTSIIFVTITIWLLRRKGYQP